MLAILLPILGPVVGKLLAGLVDKAINHWRTSAAGGGMAAVTYVAAQQILSAAGCPIEHVDLAAASLALPNVLVGVLSNQKEAGKLVDVDRIKTLSGAKIETIVVAEQTDKEGNPIMRSWLPLLIVCFFAVSCSPKGKAAIEKVEDRLQEACKVAQGAPGNLDALRPFITDEKARAGLESAELALSVVKSLCKGVTDGNPS
ncbi:MAG: hypothetical protein K0S79_88 [Nitrospira sp.]|jgi:hypothetical protein|nr:hypothetical protein [Nitrospira sp.]